MIHPSQYIERVVSEKEHALVSLFGIHQTQESDKAVREAMASVLQTYTTRLLTEIEGRVEGMKIGGPRCECKNYTQNHNCDITSNEAIDDVLSLLSDLRGEEVE